jgi:4-hydroxy-tetrahydrodipicolinate reductase
MAPVGVVVAGSAGRMGKKLVAAVAEDQGLKLSGALEAPGHPALGRDAGLVAGLGPLKVPITSDLAPLLQGARAVIDFTAADAAIKHLELCAGKGVAMVIGVTGLSERQRSKAKRLAKKIPVVLAPNMSAGVNLLFYLVEKAAAILGPEFDIEVVEAHHRLKKDAPSGTALRLAEAAAKGRGWKSNTFKYCRQGLIGARPDREIGVQTVRGGDIVGEHTVMLAGPGERVELIHRAQSRDTFARGAARAVHWLMGRPPGLYDMQDVLGLAER